MSAILNLTTGIVFLKSWSGTMSGSNTLDTTAGNSFRIQMVPPASPSLATNQSGTDLAAGDYKITVVGVDPLGGLTTAPASVTQTVGAGGAGRIIVTYVRPVGASSVRVYTSTMGGATPDRYFTSTSATTYNLDTLTGATVAALPTANTAYAVEIGTTTANWLSLPIYLPDGTAAAPALAFASQISTGVYKPVADTIVLTAAGNVVFAGTYIGIRFGSAQQLQWSADSSQLNSADTLIGRGGAAATVQLGANAAGVTDQMFKGPDRITSDGVGGNLTIAGGRNRGASVGGSVLTSTSPVAGAGVTGTLAVRTIVDSTGAFTVGSTALTGAGALYAGSFYVGTTAGVSASVTTAGLAGKTLTFVNGICTGFA
jgi:hypothetical protein